MPGGMRLGVLVPLVADLVVSPTFLAEFAGVAEDHGVESVWTPEHVVVAERYEARRSYSPVGRMVVRSTVPVPDPLEVLTFLAAHTRSVRLGSAVVVAPQGSPAVLARRAATLDRLSGGRFMLGLGIGWQREEYAEVGAAFAELGGRLEEGIEAMRALWSGSSAAFDRVQSYPQPARGAIPIVLGGHSKAEVARAGRLADGWFPFAIDPATFERRADLLRRSAEDAGRDPASVEITVRPASRPGAHEAAPETDREWVSRYAAAGATRMVIQPRVGPDGDLSSLAAQLDRCQEHVLARL